MTDPERAAAKAIDPTRVRYPVASAPKRFGRNLSAQAEAEKPQITDKQLAAMVRQIERFRRQIPQDIVAWARWVAGEIKERTTR